MSRMKPSILSSLVLLAVFLSGYEAIAQTDMSSYDGAVDELNRGNYIEAARQFREIYEGGEEDANASAQKLGELYEYGRGVPQNYKEALKLYQQSAASRISLAVSYISLGRMYQRGLGVPANDRISKSWYHRAAREGYSEAQFKLGEIYFSEWYNLEEDNKCNDIVKKPQCADKLMQAHKWLNLAGRELPEARERRDQVSEKIKQLGSDSIGTSQQMALEWRPLVWRPSGTGFFITPHGHILTAAHVVNECTEVTVQNADTPDVILAKTVQMDEELDVALLKAEPHDHNFSFATFPRSENRSLQLGADVMTVGYPYPGTLVPILEAEPVVTRGNISAISDALGEKGMQFLFTAPVQPGNSGGPVLNNAGWVVGLVKAISTLTASRSYDTVDLLRSDGVVERHVVMATTPVQNVNYAVSLDGIRSLDAIAGLLDASLDNYNKEGGKRRSDPVEIAKEARGYTVLVDCWIPPGA